MNVKHKKKGYALLTTLFTMATLGLTLGTMMKIGQQRVFTAKRLTQQIKALAYAEAGIDYAYSILSLDFAERTNTAAFVQTTSTNTTAYYSPTKINGYYTLSMGSTVGSESSTSGQESDYGEGSFAIKLTSVSNRYVVVSATGKCGDTEHVAEVVVEDIYAGSGTTSSSVDYSDMEGFNYAILSGGQFSFKGCGAIAGASVARMHSNSGIDINGSAQTEVDVSSTSKISVGNNTVKGSLVAPVLSLHKKASITGGTTTASVDPIEIPDVDLTPYYNWASKNGEVKTGGFSTSSSYTPVGGVLYVIGNVSISSHAVINGSIIATGTISVSGHVQIIPSTSVFAMASETGNINNTSSSTIKGLVYAKKGNYKQTANGRLEGQIIVGGTVQKGGNSDILLFQQSIPTPPGGTTVATPTLSLPLISAWQK